MLSSKKILLIILLCVVFFPSLLAQPADGGQPPGGGPEMMLSREKQALYKQVTDLTDDQKMLIDGIYNEFATTLKETLEESRGSNDREARRKTIRTLRSEKDALLADVLNKEQYATYTKLTSRRNRKGERSDSNQPK